MQQVEPRSGPPHGAPLVTRTIEGAQASTGAITSDHPRSSPQWQCFSITTAGGGSMPVSERNTVPQSQRDDLNQGMSPCKHKRKHSEARGQGTHAAPAMSSIHVSVSLCLYTSGTAGERVTLETTSHCHYSDCEGCDGEVLLWLKSQPTNTNVQILRRRGSSDGDRQRIQLGDTSCKPAHRWFWCDGRLLSARSIDVRRILPQ